jgi:hypothetical protein
MSTKLMIVTTPAMQNSEMDVFLIMIITYECIKRRKCTEKADNK